MLSFKNNKLFQNISWLFTYRIVKLGLAFLVTAWVARYLGAERYGTYMYAVGIAELCMLFWSQGLKEVVINETKKAERDTLKVSAASFQLMVIGNTVLYGILVLILTVFIDQQIVIILSFLCGFGIWFRAFEAYELWFHANLQVRLSVRVQFVAQFLYMSANVLLILYQAPLIWFGLTYAAQLVISGIGFLVLYKLENKRVSFFTNNWTLQRGMLSYGKFMILAKLTLLASFLIDRVLIENILDIQAVGYYTAAMKMTTTWIFIASSISLSFIPVITASDSRQEQLQRMSSMFGWITLFSMALVIPFYLFADTLVYLLYGEGYQASIGIFRILIWGLPFLLMNEAVKAWLVITGETVYYILATALTVLFIIVGNLIFTPIYSLAGAGFTFVISWVFGGCIIFLFFKKTRDLGVLTIQSFLFPFEYLKKLLGKSKN